MSVPSNLAPLLEAGAPLGPTMAKLIADWFAEVESGTLSTANLSLTGTLEVDGDTTLGTASIGTGTFAFTNTVLTMDGGGTGDAIIRLGDNYDEALVFDIAGGNDLMKIRTTDSDEAVVFPNNVEVTGTLTILGDAGTKLVTTRSATAITETVTCATGEYTTVLTDNLANAYTIGISGGNNFLTFVSTNSAEAVLVANTLASTPPANQTIVNDATITLPTGCNKIVDNAGNVTGIILTAGTVDGQILNLINAGSGSVTFATAATSNVADGTSAVIATLRAVTLVWDSGAARWFRTG